MQAQDLRPTERFYTVAVWLPGTQARVLVTKLAGPPAEALETARQIVQNFSEVAPVRWLHKVVATDQITDVMTPETEQELAP